MADETAGTRNLVGWTGRVRVSEWTGGDGGEEWALQKYGERWNEVEILTTVKGVSRKKQDMWIVEFPEGSEPEDEMTGDKVRKLLTAPDEDEEIGSTMPDRGVGLKDRNGKERIPEKIIDGKDRDECTVYKVKWKGDKNPTWVHWSELGARCNELVEAYEERRKRASAPNPREVGRISARQARGTGKGKRRIATSSRAKQLMTKSNARRSISPNRGQRGKTVKRRLTQRDPTTTPARTQTRNAVDKITPQTTPDPKRAKGKATDDHENQMNTTDNTHSEHTDTKHARKENTQATLLARMKAKIERQEKTITDLRRQLSTANERMSQLEVDKHRRRQGVRGEKSTTTSPPTPASTPKSTTTEIDHEARLTKLERAMRKMEAGRGNEWCTTECTPANRTQQIPTSTSSSSSHTPSEPAAHTHPLPTPTPPAWTYAQTNSQAYTPYTSVHTAWGAQRLQCHPQRAARVQQGYQQARQHTPPPPQTPHRQTVGKANPEREIVIKGVPYRQGEDLRRIVQNLVKAAGHQRLEEREYQCMRALGRNKTKTEQEDNKNTPRIIIQLASQHTKNTLKRRPPNTLTLKDTGIEDLPDALHSRQIHMNENLTAEQSRIFYMVRQSKEGMGYRFAWTQDGVVLMREREGAIVREIDNETTLERLIGEVQREKERQDRGIPGYQDMETVVEE
jgi:hypothetical protein